MADDGATQLSMTTEQVSQFHEFLMGERRFRWDVACGRVPGRNDGVEGKRIKRKEAEAIDAVIETLCGLLGLDPTDSFRATGPIAIPRGLSHEEVVALSTYLSEGQRDNPMDSPEEYMFDKAHRALYGDAGGLHAWEQANPLPPPAPAPRAVLVSVSMRGKVVWEPGMSEAEERRRMEEALRELPEEK
jgi:hypothetical protein